jgi:hypothetical protein
MSEIFYKRLPGRKKNLVGRYTLYQGPDHILQIFSRFGMEDYRRFYFADIQCLSTRKTTAGLVQNIIMAVIGALFGLTLLPGGDVSTTIGIVMVSVFGILLACNVIMGPTCETTIQTAVQTEKLYPLNRLRTAQKVMDRLSPLIIAVQGEIDSLAMGGQPARTEPPKPANQLPAGAKAVVRPPTPDKGYAHLALFGLIVLDMVIVLLNTGLHLAALALVSTVVSLVLAVSVIVALVRQTDNRMPRPIRVLTWTALVHVCLSWIMGYVFTMAMFFKNPQVLSNQWHMLEYVASMTFFQSPLVSTIHCLTIGGAIGIGIPGLVLLNQHIKSIKSGVASAVRTETGAPAGS